MKLFLLTCKSVKFVLKVIVLKEAYCIMSWLYKSCWNTLTFIHGITRNWTPGSIFQMQNQNECSKSYSTCCFLVL